MSESSTNGKKMEYLLFSLLDNPTLNANFKWQPLKVADLITEHRKKIKLKTGLKQWMG